MAHSATAAPILGTNADGSASAESARGLLLTVLGEFARPGDSVAWTQTLVTLLGGLGVKDKAVRQALSRMERPDWLERRRQGRSVRWVLGDELSDQLEGGGSRIYRFGQERTEWDGSWLLIVPGGQATDRGTEFRLARALRWIGCGPAHRGMWVCPWMDRQPAVIDALNVHGLGADTGVSLFQSRLVGHGTHTDLVSGAWDLDSLSDQYGMFLNRFEDVDGATLGTFEAAVELVELVHQWRKFPLMDPELPEELLPADWAGHRAAELFASNRSALLPRATQWWVEAEA